MKQFNENISGSSAPIVPMGGNKTIMQVDKYPIMKKIKKIFNKSNLSNKGK